MAQVITTILYMENIRKDTVDGTISENRQYLTCSRPNPHIFEICYVSGYGTGNRLYVQVVYNS